MRWGSRFLVVSSPSPRPSPPLAPSAAQPCRTRSAGERAWRAAALLGKQDALSVAFRSCVIAKNLRLFPLLTPWPPPRRYDLHIRIFLPGKLFYLRKVFCFFIAADRLGL